MNTVKDVEGEI
jgi:hypothetical protein